MSFVRFIVTYVDTDQDGQCDGKARIEAICNNEEEAKAFIHNAIEEYIDDHTDDNGQCLFIADFGKMNVHTEDYRNYTEWNFEKKEFTLSENEVHNIWMEYNNTHNKTASKEKIIKMMSEMKNCFIKCKGIWKND